MTVIPFSVYIIALSGSFDAGNSDAVLFALLALVSAELIWQIIKWFNPFIQSVTTNINN